MQVWETNIFFWTDMFAIISFKIYSYINIGMDYFYNNSVFLKLENTDYLDSQRINQKLWEN